MAMSKGISSGQVLEITECVICTESFKEPKVLPCIHTFCLHCLEKYGEEKEKDPEDKLDCPLCRKDFVIPLGGFRELPNNYFIIQLMQLDQSSGSDSKEQSVVCDWCSELNEKPPAAVYCIECEQHLCQPCSTRHGKQKLCMGHQVLSLKDKPSPEQLIKMAPSYCGKHRSKEIELYCFDCKMVSCYLCYVAQHSKHQCCDLKESAEIFRKQLTADMNKVSPYILRNKSEIKQIEERKGALSVKVTAAKVEIKKTCDSLKSLLESHHIQLMSELNEFEKEMFKELETRKEEVVRQSVILESYKKYCEEMTLKGTACEISRSANDLRVRADDLVKAQEEFVTTGRLLKIDVKFTPSLTATDSVSNWIGQLGLFKDIEIEKFLNENAMVERFIQMKTGKVEMLEKYLRTELDQIKRDLKDHQVDLSLNRGHERTGCQISGNSRALDDAEKKINYLIGRIKTKDCMVDPNLVRLLLKEQCRRVVSRIADDHNAIIKYSDEEQGCTYPSQFSPLTLTIYAMKAEDIEDTITDIQNMYQEKIINGPKFRDFITNLSSSQQQEIKQLGTKYMIRVDIDRNILNPEIRLNGDYEGITRAHQDIVDLYLVNLSSTYERRELEMIGKTANWQYEEGGKFHSFDFKTRGTIEKAYAANQQTVDVKTSRKTYRITFSSMTEEIVGQQGTKFKVRRYEGKIPRGWSPIPSGQEWTSVTLNPTDPEYQKVFANLAQPTLKIVKIERIQNPKLFQVYKSYKQSMDELNPPSTTHSNERRLWHGTAGTSVADINDRNFNRSYCGQHGVSIGNGVYFAVGSSYSISGYCPPDTSGIKHIYQARVLTGKFTQGAGGMKDAPAPFDSVTDNVQTPGMFVVFRDFLTYPEYHISFQ